MSEPEWAEISKRYQAGESQGILAKEFGINHTTISTRLRAAGIPVQIRTATQKEIARIIELHDQGLTVARISKDLGFSDTTNRNHLKAHGAQLRGPQSRMR